MDRSEGFQRPLLEVEYGYCPAVFHISHIFSFFYEHKNKDQKEQNKSAIIQRCNQPSSVEMSLKTDRSFIVSSMKMTQCLPFLMCCEIRKRGLLDEPPFYFHEEKGCLFAIFTKKMLKTSEFWIV